MSIDAIRWAWKQQLRATSKLVLLSLSDRAGEHHDCWPSISRLANDTCLDRKTIMSALKDIEQAGLIKSLKIGGKVTTYYLIGVENRHDENSDLSNKERPQSRTKTSTKNGTGTSTKNGTSPKIGTSTKNGTTPVPKTVPPPVPKTGHEPINRTYQEPTIRDIYIFPENCVEKNESGEVENLPEKRPKFLKPTLDELHEFQFEKKLKDHCEQFFYFYESNGWKVGNNKMIDWRAAYRNWCMRQESYANKNKLTTNGDNNGKKRISYEEWNSTNF